MWPKLTLHLPSPLNLWDCRHALTDVPKLCFHSSQRCKDKWEGYEGPSELALGQVQTYCDNLLRSGGSAI